MSDERRPMHPATGRPGAFNTVCGLIAAGLIALLCACGGEGAGAGGRLPGTTQSAPSSSTSSVDPLAGTVTVSETIPTSGAGTVITSAGVVTAGQGTLRQVQFEGRVADTGTVHRFTVYFDSASSVVIRAAHAWSLADGSTPALLECVLNQNSVSLGASQQLCGVSIRVDPVLGQVTFARALLTSGTTFRSVLTGVARYAPN